MGRFKTAKEAIDYLNDCRWAVWKLGLSRTSELLRRLGNPQDSLKFVHVAGTNGKGSTCAMTEAVLRSAGYRTGMYPSPFIESFNERIQVDGQNIPDDDLARIAGAVADEADRMDDHPRHFELITAMGMLYFRERRCDIVVLEVGMGGAFDSTNVIKAPEAAVICNIGLDHTEYLGDTVEEIAATKGGIIKKGCDVILYDNAPGVLKVIEEIAHEKGCSVHHASSVKLEPEGADLYGQRFIKGGRQYELSLLGAHQRENARTVFKIIDVLRDRGWKIPDEAVAEGLRSVKWPARFEVLSHRPLFILDGGHNPQCAGALSASIEEYLPGEKVTFLAGMLADKDYLRTIEIISPYAAEFVCLTPESDRALPAAELCEAVRSTGCKAETADTAESAVRLAVSKGRPVVVFGSLYMAGAVRSAFRSAFGKEG